MIIPMPGHPVQEKGEEETKQILNKLTDLIEEHDVIFLGLDSREARWLPSVICAAKQKVQICTTTKKRTNTRQIKFQILAINWFMNSI